MKCKVVIGTDNEEMVVVYARERTKFVDDIENFVLENSLELVGYKEKSAIILNPHNVYCFVIEDGKTYAVTKDDKFLLKIRLYQVEEILTENFVKVNQSCIANVKKIDRFDATPYGSLNVVFKNGYIDYVSRRQLKIVKERLGV